MTETILAGSQIEVGEHHTATWLGMTVNTDTIYSTAIAAAIVIAMAFYLRSKVTSTDVPGGVQLFFEAITIQMRNQVEGAIGMRIAPFVLPLLSVYCNGRTDSQLEIRMNTKIVTASGSTKGAIRIPMAPST